MTMPELPTDLPVVSFATRDDWERWLAEHHARSARTWLRFAKKASGLASVSYQEAVDLALCYGWIDGQLKSLDETYYLQRFSPRRPRSKWSKRNRIKVAALIESGRMQAAGLREVERAQADGRWEAAYDSPSTATVPDDLAAELDSSPAACDFFSTVNSANRKTILYRISDAKRPETRVRRIRQYVDMLGRGERLLACPRANGSLSGFAPCRLWLAHRPSPKRSVPGPRCRKPLGCRPVGRGQAFLLGPARGHRAATRGCLPIRSLLLPHCRRFVRRSPGRASASPGWSRSCAAGPGTSSPWCAPGRTAARVTRAALARPAVG